MFGRRRRPVLGAAVLVGASRSAARHEVQKQALVDSQREAAIQQEIDMRRRQEEEQDRRTQRAVDEAVKKAVAENPPAQQAGAGPSSQQQQYYNPQQQMPAQAQDPALLMASAGQAYAPVASAAPPPYMSGTLSPDGRPKSAQGIKAEGSKAQFCTQCGFGCQLGDRFCRQCGAKQAV